MIERMNAEESEIEHFHKTKDDAGEWDEPIHVAQRRRRDAVVSVRFSPSELETIRSATTDGNISQFIREATLKAAASQPMTWSPVGTFGTSTGVSSGSFVIDGVIQISDPTQSGLNLVMDVHSTDKTRPR